MKRIFDTAGEVSLSSFGNTCVFLESFAEYTLREKGLNFTYAYPSS
jgi:hypothetical protein